MDNKDRKIYFFMVSLLFCVNLIFFIGCSFAKVKSTEKEKDTIVENNLKIESYQKVENSNVSIDVQKRKIFIPEEHIVGIKKNIYAENEFIKDSISINEICEAINEAELVYIMVNGKKLIDIESDGLLNQYPILLQCKNDNEYCSIEGIKNDGKFYYTLLKFVISKEDFLYDVEEDGIDFYDEKAYVDCYVESEKLYHAVKEFWGEQLKLDDIQESCEIKIYYNTKSILAKQKNEENSIYFSEEDCKTFVDNLKREAFPIYDNHAFGISIEILGEDKELLTLYYAEDGCQMFQLDGVCYRLESTDKSAQIADRYIKILENKMNE